MQRATTEADSHNGSVRHDWSRAQALALYEAPFNDLLFRAQTVHRRYFDPNAVQMSRLLSIKTGGCAEDCGYCSQSRAPRVRPQGQQADGGQARGRRGGKARGCRRHALLHGRRLALARRTRDMDAVCAMVEGVKALGMETCMTLGMLDRRRDRTAQARRPRLLQPQHRYVRALLQQGHHDAHVRRPARDAGARARGRHQGVLAAASSAWARRARIASTCW